MYHQWESNPHEHYCSTDFKSVASTNSAIMVNKGEGEQLTINRIY